MQRQCIIHWPAISISTAVTKHSIHLLLRYAVVEDDCNTALALEDDYVKAYLRRGVARRHLGKLTEAVEGK